MVVLGRERWLGRHGLVELRVERLIDGVDLLSPAAPSDLERIFFSTISTPWARVTAIDRRGVDVREACQIVERVDADAW